jgi:hypothetical protein
MQGVADPIGFDPPLSCVYTPGPTNGRAAMAERCEVKGCFWRRWHALAPDKFPAKVAPAIDPMLL